MMRKFLLAASLVGLLTSTQCAAALTRGPEAPEAARLAISAIVDQMEEAVLAGDQEAYMAHVSKADSFFRMEQENWAKDLDRHLPVQFVVQLVWDPHEGPATPSVPSRVTQDEPTAPMEPDAGAADVGRVTCEWVMTWRMEGGRERSIAYPVSFVMEDGGWKFAGEVWEAATAEAPADAGEPGTYNNSVLHTDQAELAQAMVELLPEVRAHVDDGFQKPGVAPVQVKLYRSMKHLQASIFLSYTEGLGGWYEPDEAVKILAGGRAGSAGRYKAVLAHEYAHLVTGTLGDRSLEVPWWAHEGMAELASMRYQPRRHAGYMSMIRRAAESDRLVEWDQMENFHETPVNLYPFVYAQGYVMVNYISETYGRDKRNAWMTRLAAGDGVQLATETALGVSWEEVDRAFVESLQPEAPADAERVELE